MSEVQGGDAVEAVRPRAKSSAALACSRIVRLLWHTFWIYTGLCLRRSGLSEAEKLEDAKNSACFWLAKLTRLLGFEVTVSGHIPEEAVLFTPNHIGYVDILAMGSVCRTFFVSKSDVESWPLMGRVFLGSYQLSIERTKRSAIVEANRKIGERIQAGHSVCVFLEGTTSGGGDLLPFHASLVQSAIDADAKIVPVAIHWYSDDDAIEIADDVAYWKDHVFGPHLFRLMGLRGVKAHITFGEPVDTAAYEKRKDLAEDLRETVIELLETPA